MKEKTKISILIRNLLFLTIILAGSFFIYDRVILPTLKDEEKVPVLQEVETFEADVDMNYISDFVNFFNNSSYNDLEAYFFRQESMSGSQVNNKVKTSIAIVRLLNTETNVISADAVRQEVKKIFGNNTVYEPVSPIVLGYTINYDKDNDNFHIINDGNVPKETMVFTKVADSFIKKDNTIEIEVKFAYMKVTSENGKFLIKVHSAIETSNYNNLAYIIDGEISDDMIQTFPTYIFTFSSEGDNVIFKSVHIKSK